MQAATNARRPSTSQALTKSLLLRRDEDSTQARLMKRRGDLSKTAFCFNASLPPPGPGAREKGLGMDVIVADSVAGHRRASLVVNDVDADPSQSTPVAEWNHQEKRRANRGAGEEHASFAIKPGDKICAVNGTHGDDMAMAELLASAADLDSPKAVNLTLARCRSDVLGPHDTLSSDVPPKLPTNGARTSLFQRRRSRSNPDAVDLPAIPKGFSHEDTKGRRCGELTVSTLSSLQWNSLLSGAGHSQGKGCQSQKMVEDESSTRSPSMPLSGRSSSASTGEPGPPLLITTTQKSQAYRNFARVGRATFSN
jgi:hypothetical protein